MTEHEITALANDLTSIAREYGQTKQFRERIRRRITAALTELAVAELGRVMSNGIPHLRPVIRVAVISVDGASLTVPLDELASVLDADRDYAVQIRTMSVREFEALPESRRFMSPPDELAAL